MEGHTRVELQNRLGARQHGSHGPNGRPNQPFRPRSRPRDHDLRAGMAGDSLGNQLANPVHTEEGLINLLETTGPGWRTPPNNKEGRRSKNWEPPHRTRLSDTLGG